MNYFLEGLGVSVGIIAGVIVAIVVQKLIAWKREKQKMKNLKFEFKMNIKKIGSLLEELGRYRNAVNADNLDRYFGYFDLSKFIWITANNMFYSGLLYKYLEDEDIDKFQTMFSDFSIYMEDYMNNQVRQNKANFNKQKAVADVDFWENKFKTHKKSFNEVLEKLK